MWPKPLLYKHRLGLLPLVKKLRIRRGAHPITPASEPGSLLPNEPVRFLSKMVNCLSHYDHHYAYHTYFPSRDHTTPLVRRSRHSRGRGRGRRTPFTHPFSHQREVRRFGVNPRLAGHDEHPWRSRDLGKHFRPGGERGNTEGGISSEPFDRYIFRFPPKYLVLINCGDAPGMSSKPRRRLIVHQVGSGQPPLEAAASANSRLLMSARFFSPVSLTKNGRLWAVHFREVDTWRRLSVLSAL